ncbi:hypothetical protein ACFS4T_17415 [Pseudomonas lini]
MLGYWNKPELTRQVVKKTICSVKRGFTSPVTCSNGTVNSISTSWVEKTTYLRGGLFQVNPREIEHVIVAHEAVSEAVVIAFPDEVAGQVPKACVVLKEGHELSADALIQYCATQLDWYMVPAIVSFHAALPRNLNGKNHGASPGRRRYSHLINTQCVNGITEMTTDSNPAFVDSAMNKLADYFDDLANGRVQVPKQPVTTRIRERIQDDDVRAYHDLLVTQAGPLFFALPGQCAGDCGGAFAHRCGARPIYP